MVRERGIMETVNISQRYANALTEKHESHNFSVMKGRAYDKIVSEHVSYGHASVHAFVEKKTGKLIKAGTWAAPQKDKKGVPAYRYDLSTEEGFTSTVELSDCYGSYLYLQ